MSDDTKPAPEAVAKKKPTHATPKFATAEMLAEARAITKNLTWDDLVRIASKPKHAGWILWKESGIVEQISLVPSNAWIVLARGWKSSARHAIVHRPAEKDYGCVEIDAETKRPIQVPA